MTTTAIAHPPILLDHAAPADHSATVQQIRVNLAAIEDWATQLRRARQAADPKGDAIAYEGHRQHERAITRTLAELGDKLDYLTLTLADAGRDAMTLAG